MLGSALEAVSARSGLKQDVPRFRVWFAAKVVGLGITAQTLVGLLCQSSHNFKIALCKLYSRWRETRYTHSVTNHLHMIEMLFWFKNVLILRCRLTFRSLLVLSSRPHIPRNSSMITLIARLSAALLMGNFRYGPCVHMWTAVIQEVDHVYLLQIIRISCKTCFDQVNILLVIWNKHLGPYSKVTPLNYVVTCLLFTHPQRNKEKTNKLHCLRKYCLWRIY
jgi:hypothetical protein